MNELMLRMMGLAILLLVISGLTWALPEARLLNQSSSGQTVVFNLGSHDGMAQGDYAVVVKQIRSLESRDLRLIPVAKARNIKLNSDSSVWILYKVFDPELLVKGEKYSILSESFMLNGRRSLQLGRISVVTKKDEASKQAGYKLNDDKDRLGKLNHKYQTIQETHETKNLSDNDVDQVDVEVWEPSKDDRHRSSLYKSANKEEFRRQLRLATFEKMVVAYLNKVNDPEFNYDQFYEKQRKTAYANEFVANRPDSEYQQFLREQSALNTGDAKLYRSLLDKGEAWSEDFSDEELRLTLKQVSVLQEKDRRLFVISKPTRYMLGFDYGMYLTDAQTKKDPQHQRDSRYATEVDFEATPFLKHTDLERFTVNGTFRLNHTAFDADNYNANLEEYSASIGANWYPWYAPYAVESPVMFLGSYIRSGFAKATAPTVDQSANYTVMSLPGFRAGLKYLMRNNFGLRLTLSFETLRIERYETSRLNTVLPERGNIAEGKLGIGLAYVF